MRSTYVDPWENIMTHNRGTAGTHSGAARARGGWIPDGKRPEVDGEILSNVSKARSEISMTFARNART
jgi:hypothetical protein